MLFSNQKEELPYMDIKAKVSEAVEKITSNKNLMEQFQKDPIKAVESVIGVDLPDGIADKVVDAVKVKLSAKKLEGVAGKIKNLF